MNKIEQGSVWCSTCGILCIWSRCTVVWTFCHGTLVTFPIMMHDELRLCQQDAMGDFSHWKSEAETVSWCFHARDPFGQRALAISPRLFSHSVGFNQFRWNGLVPALSLYTASQNTRTLEVRCAVLGGVCYVQISRWTHHFYTLEISCALVFCCSLPWVPWMPWHLERWFT